MKPRAAFALACLLLPAPAVAQTPKTPVDPNAPRAGKVPISGPTRPAPLGPATDITAAGDHTCARFAGPVKCWGSNGFGQLGVGATDARGDGPGELGAALAAVDLGGGTVVQVAAGATTNCALFADGTVKCWGDRFQAGPAGAAPGQLGAALPTVDLGGDRAKRIFVGPTKACAIVVTGALRCWSAGPAGPAIDLGPSTARAAALASAHTCALLDDGATACWGPMYLGPSPLGVPPNLTGAQLPRIRFADSTAEREVLRRAVAIGLGGNEPLALLEDGTVRRWFNPPVRASGSPPTFEAKVLARPWTLPGAAIAIATGDTLSCALVTGGSVFCTDNRAATPVTPAAVALPAGRSATAITAGRAHACALLDDGSVACWGANGSGQLGQGDTTARAAAVIVPL